MAINAESPMLVREGISIGLWMAGKSAPLKLRKAANAEGKRMR
jgi:CRISPR/Cas system-associated protein Cas10 (large subunit of type III CRISPR-Cas system)